MNAVERLRCRVQVALVVEAHKGTSAIPDVLELAHRYSIQGDPTLIQSSIKDWEARGLLIVSRTLDGKVYAAVRRDSLVDALSLILDVLDADIFEVDWKKEEILTDSSNIDLIAAPDRWKILEVEKNRPEQAQAAANNQGGIQITNTFAPTNNVSTSSLAPPRAGISWAGWAGVVIAVTSVIVALWIGGKI